MGSSSSHSQSKTESKSFLELVNRPFNKEAFVLLLGTKTMLVDFKGVSQKRGQDLERFCSQCDCYYDKNSIAFYLGDGKAVCFACYVTKRVSRFLLHRHLCQEVTNLFPKELVPWLNDWTDYRDYVYQKENDQNMDVLLPICYIYPHLQYDIIKKIKEVPCDITINYDFINPSGIVAQIKVRRYGSIFWLEFSENGTIVSHRTIKTKDLILFCDKLNERIKSCLLIYNYRAFYRDGSRTK